MGDAWDLVADAADRSGVAIEPLTTLEDAERVNTVIGAVWGEQVLGREVLRAFQLAGCVLQGARDASEDAPDLVGFVFGVLGFERGLHLHSHMLAVVPGWQSRGVGRALKLAQRAACLDLDIEDVRWTYDPLLAPNARFNLMKLGAIATSFLPEFYGAMTDVLNRGERTDRFEVTWTLTADRVVRAIAPGARAPTPGATSETEGGEVPVLLDAVGDPAAPQPSATGAQPGRRALVAIPRDHLALRQRDPALGAVWRDAAAEAFRACFEAGLVATGFTPDGRYVFEGPGPR